MGKSSILISFLVLVAALAAGLISFSASPVATHAAATSTITINRYDAYKNLISTVTRDYTWLEANLPVYGDGNTHYYCQGPSFNYTDLDALWNPAESINIESRDMGRVKGSDLKDLCDLAGGAGTGDVIQLKDPFGYKKYFDYENIYTPTARQGRMVIAWFNADEGGYPPAYESAMRLVFFADQGVNPNGWHVFGNWDMHETMPARRWHFFNGTDPSSSDLSVYHVSIINIYQPELTVCDAAGNLKLNFLPGQTVFVKGLGLSAGVSYKLWIQPEPAAIVPLDSLDRPLYGTPFTLIPAFDPSSVQETVVTNTHGDLAPVPVWNIPASAAAGKKYDIIADCQSAGTTGQYDNKDYVASAGFQGLSMVASLNLPSAAFTADVISGLVPLTVHFTDQSTGSPLVWKWDFNNDGTVDSTQTNPLYTFTASGRYDVKLTVINSDGSDEELKNSFITVDELPTAAFTANVTSGTAPLSVNFTDLSSGNPASWAWDFENDGIVDSSARHPTFTYSQPGWYSVKLAVTNAGGTDAEVKIDYIRVDEPPLSLLWGPYLSGAGTSGTLINIKTSLSTNATVEYAVESYYNSSGAYSLSASDGLTTQLHHIPLSGLEPATTYHYRVNYQGISTPDFHFRTLPASGNFTFAVYADTQDNPPLYYQSQRHRLIADSLAQDPDIAFTVIAGDLVGDGNDLSDWDRFFEAAGSMLSGIYVFPALGNHEDHSPFYSEIFSLPDYYSLDCSNAHFTVLDTTGNITAQTAWLESDLDSPQPWKFVFFHHPMYSASGWSDLKEDWEPLFAGHAVEAVWNGHHHSYQRYLKNGIMYSIIGTGGGAAYYHNIIDDPDYQNGLEDFLGYARVTVDSAADTSLVQIIRVADISTDGKQITPCPPGTLFESYLLHIPAPAPVIISATAGLHGSISPSGNVSVEYGQSQTFHITPDSGFAISSLMVDGAAITPPVSSYTFTGVTTGHHISATFTRALEVSLVQGWNTFSTPVSLDPAHNTLGDILAGVDFDVVYSFDAAAGYWSIPSIGYSLQPCESLYVHLRSSGKVVLKVNPAFTATPELSLETGWNLIGLAAMADIKATEALQSVENGAGGLTGYTQVVSQGYNVQESWVYLRGQPISGTEGAGWLKPYRGYWIFMVNPGLLTGFTVTPLP
jgi:PKD repeat protein